jgi:hypothetical protein
MSQNSRIKIFKNPQPLKGVWEIILKKIYSIKPLLLFKNREMYRLLLPFRGWGLLLRREKKKEKCSTAKH